MSSGNSSQVETADLLHSASIRLLRLVRTEDAQAGIGPAQLSALSVLVFGGAKTVSELATLEQVRPPTMSRIVEGLAKKKTRRNGSTTRWTGGRFVSARRQRAKN